MNRRSFLLAVVAVPLAAVSVRQAVASPAITSGTALALLRPRAMRLYQSAYITELAQQQRERHDLQRFYSGDQWPIEVLRARGVPA